MDIDFATTKLEKQFNSRNELIRVYGSERAKVIMKRMAQLVAADNMGHLRGTPGRFHALKGNYAGAFTLDLDGPYRLFFRPSSDPVPLLEDGAVNLFLVTSVTVIEVGDPHE